MADGSYGWSPTGPPPGRGECGCGYQDDLDRIAASLARLCCPGDLIPGALSVIEPVTGLAVRVEVAPRIRQAPPPAPRYNAPGRAERIGQRARPLLDTPVRPRRLGHAVIGSTDYQTSNRFFVQGLGFRVSDRIKGTASFLRCSTDHHNLLVSAAPVDFLHHTSWQVDDIDAVGRGAFAILRRQPGTTRLGPGQAHAGLELLLVPEGPGRQLQRVLLRHGLHRR